MLDRHAELAYSNQNGNEITLTDNLRTKILNYTDAICKDENIDALSFIDMVNKNQLFKSQIESLIVAFELVWRLAKVSFVDTDKAASSERTGGMRYPKSLIFTTNIDVIHAVVESNRDAYIRIIMSWIGLKVKTSSDCEQILMLLFTALSEGAVFKLRDEKNDIIFNQNSIYKKILETSLAVDINGDSETKGSLRILKSLLSDGMNPYLIYSGGSVTTDARKLKDLEYYQKRVETMLRLSATKIVGVDGLDTEQNADDVASEVLLPEEFMGTCTEVQLSPRVNKLHPLNFICYGAPGTGKTYSTVEYALAIVENREVDLSKKSPEERKTVVEKYKSLIQSGQVVFTTFHQSYGYEDFIQGLRPDATSKTLSFLTVDGVFKKVANAALHNTDHNYVIIIDEINRANISKVFGELITLIEEDKRWGELNETSVTLPSGEVFTVPNNLYIVGAMNSADKSISLIDTALRRRFEFIEQMPDATLVENSILKNVLVKLNEKLVDELDSTDLLVGHSYFLNRSEKDLCQILNNSIIPLLYEYFYDNRKKVAGILKDITKELDVEILDNKMGRLKARDK